MNSNVNNNSTISPCEVDEKMMLVKFKQFVDEITAQSGRNYKISILEKYRLTPTFARRHVKGKTNEQLINECNRDLNKICELPVDVKLKLKLCLETDNILYLNFIRNEAQQSAHTPKANRKNR